MKRRADVVDLAVHRETRGEPHVRVILESWHLGDGRWYTEPETRSRIGDLSRGTWILLGDACSDYGADLRAYAGRPDRERIHRRRHRVRARR